MQGRINYGRGLNPDLFTYGAITLPTEEQNRSGYVMVKDNNQY